MNHRSDIIRVDAGLRFGKPYINTDPKGNHCKHIACAIAYMSNMATDDSPAVPSDTAQPMPKDGSTMAYFGEWTFKMMSPLMFYGQLSWDGYRMAKAFNADYQNTMSTANSNLLPKNTISTGASIAATYVGRYGCGKIGSILGGSIGGYIAGKMGDQSAVVVGTCLGAVLGSAIAGSYCSNVAREKVEQWID